MFEPDKEWPQIPVYRVLDEQGKVVGDVSTPDDLAKKIYINMVRTRVMDDFLLNCQRQGRITFYMASLGEESLTGTAAALDNSDDIFPQYREQATLLWRGFTYQEFCDQCACNINETGKGRQMPVHYGSPKHHFITVSSPLATQIPQASGYAYGLKMAKSKNICVCFMGDGSASEGDFHAGLNIASTRSSPVLFICRNNGYAISTPTKEQYHGDGIADRMKGYNIACIRVDGSDPLALYQSTKLARDYVTKNSAPFFMELMSYRMSHHSTSDDSSAYRSKEEMDDWKKRDCVVRMKNYVIGKKIWSDEEDKKLIADSTNEIKECIKKAEVTPMVTLEELYKDVYDKIPKGSEILEAELKKNAEKHKDFYNKKH